MEYNYLIVEDNPGCVLNLRSALKSYANFTEVGTAPTLSKGISMALSTRPHLIFLDVQLGDENGFDLIKGIRQFTADFPFIIMTTDFDKYAREAVNSDVLYFLDKPIDPDELTIALQKLERKALELQNHITIKNSEGHFFLQLDQILYIQSQSNCCIIFKENDSSMFVTKTLKELESILPSPFLRIHRSYIVNARHIKMLNTTQKKLKLNTLNIENSDFVELPISDLYLEKVRQTLLTARSK